MSDDDTPRRRGRRVADSDEEEEAPRRGRRQADSDGEEEEAPRSRGKRGRQNSEEESQQNGEVAGETLKSMNEARRKKVQDQLLEGILKYAESKYGKKRPVKAGDKQSAKEDYELYLRSLKAKVKTASDKLNTILKQKKDIHAKVAQAEKEHGLQQGKLTKAEEEKQKAINDGRDPVLPKDFIVPQTAKKANAGLGAMVMKASASMWEDKFSQMRSKKTAGGNTPEWMAKQKKSDKTTALLKVGQQKKASKKDGDAPSFGASKLKSSGSAARRRKEEEEKPNPFKVSLKKTGKLEEEEAKAKPAPKKADPPPGAAEEEKERPRRRGRPRNDSE